MVSVIFKSLSTNYGGMRNGWKRSYYFKFQLNRHFLYFSVENIYFRKKIILLKSQYPFRFSSYCHFVFCTALSMSQSIFSMLLNVSAMLSLAGTGQRLSKKWSFSRIFVKIDQSYFFKNFNYAFRCPRKTLKAIKDSRRSWRIRFQLLKS